MKQIFKLMPRSGHYKLLEIPKVPLRCFVGILLLLFSCSLYAQVEWVGGTDRDWNEPSNWSPAGVPSATIPGTGVLTISDSGPLDNIPLLVDATKIDVRAGGSLIIPADRVFRVNSTTLGSPSVELRDSLMVDVGGKLIIGQSDNAGIELRTTDGLLIVRDSVIINESDMNGLEAKSGAKVEVEPTGVLYIRASGINGISMSGELINDGQILITDIVDNGIHNTGTGQIINNNEIRIFQVGDEGLLNDNSFINSIGAWLAISAVRDGNGIEHAGGTFESFGTIAIDSVNGHAIFLEDLFTSSNDTIYIGTNHPKTGTGASVGCTITGDGINVFPSAIHNVLDGSNIFIGGADCPIDGAGINNSGMFMTDNDNTYIRIRTVSPSIVNTGTFTNNKPTIVADAGENDDDCVIIDVDNVIDAQGAGNFQNRGIILTSAPFGVNEGTVADALKNTGIISDVNGAFLADSTTRAPVTALGNTGGILVAPYYGESYTSPLEDFLITGLSAPPPFENEYAVGNFVLADFNDVTNELTLNTVSTNYNLPFEIQKAESGDRCTEQRTAIQFETAPTDEIACNSSIQLSLRIDGTAIIDPDMILESTHANSSDFIVEILTGSGAGTNMVDCSYLGQTIEVMVTAPGTSGNRCWGRVTIEDKIGPDLSINDTTFYCNQDYSPEKLGFPVGTDACSDSVTFTYLDSDVILNLCGEDADNPDTLRIITRTFTGRDQFWNATTITQTIYELRPTLNDLVFPSNFTGANALQCNSANTSDAVTGRPYFRIGTDSIPVEASCKFGVNMEEKEYDLGCPGKKQIQRTWTVMDWCNLTSGAAVVPMTQIIDIVDTIPPTFDSIKASDIVILSTQSHKCMVTIRPPAPQNIQDACSGTTYRIQGPTGTIYNDPNDSLTNIPFDTTTLEYIITDGCGNEARDTVTFILKDEVAPLALAQELTVNLVDGEGNTWVYAESFDAGSSDNCSGLDSILISKDGVNFADRLAFDCADVGTLLLTLKVVDKAGNASVATRTINVSDNSGFCGTPACVAGVTIDTAFMIVEPTHCDSSDGSLIVNVTTNGANLEYSLDGGANYQPLSIPFPKQDTSLKFITVREINNTTCITTYDNGPVRPIGYDTCRAISISAQAAIAGHIQNENGETVEAVNISIGGYEMAPAITGTDGTFMFEEIPLDGDYMITPEKDMNHTNGITTFDIVLLSKHILGLKRLDSPYKMIAADINHSGNISAYDMVLLRQVILGIKNDFPNNTSWRFIDAAYEFLHPEHPFDENYPEAYEIKDFSDDMMSLDFIGVKIGDLNNTAAVNQLQVGESRSTAQSLTFQIEEQVKTVGETVTVDFKASNFESILGYQFTLDFNGNDLKFEQIKMGAQTSFENFNLSMIQRGIITTSWNESEAINLSKDEVLFSLVFAAKNDVRISEAINISSDITTAEAYTGREEVINVSLKVHTPHTDTNGFTLYQNVPNPFTGETIIGFELPAASATTLTIFDMSGKTVKVEKGTFHKGYNQILLDGKAFDEHGMFYYQLETNRGIETKKMILLKR